MAVGVALGKAAEARVVVALPELDQAVGVGVAAVGAAVAVGVGDRADDYRITNESRLGRCSIGSKSLRYSSNLASVPSTT